MVTLITLVNLVFAMLVRTVRLFSRYTWTSAVFGLPSPRLPYWKVSADIIEPALSGVPQTSVLFAPFPAGFMSGTAVER
jgi:hypothetical protein